ncbi:MAG: hypothetical protein HQ558_01975 [Candidatus Omnitrophica bacterium]|nr:hypothetical protein [Candidatus Omnitrophota bacterium]
MVNKMRNISFKTIVAVFMILLLCIQDAYALRSMAYQNCVQAGKASSQGKAIVREFIESGETAITSADGMRFIFRFSTKDTDLSQRWDFVVRAYACTRANKETYISEVGADMRESTDGSREIEIKRLYTAWRFQERKILSCGISLLLQFGQHNGLRRAIFSRHSSGLYIAALSSIGFRKCPDEYYLEFLLLPDDMEREGYNLPPLEVRGPTRRQIIELKETYGWEVDEQHVLPSRAERFAALGLGLTKAASAGSDFEDENMQEVEIVVRDALGISELLLKWGWVYNDSADGETRQYSRGFHLIGPGVDQYYNSRLAVYSQMFITGEPEWENTAKEAVSILVAAGVTVEGSRLQSEEELVGQLSVAYRERKEFWQRSQNNAIAMARKEEPFEDIDLGMRADAIFSIHQTNWRPVRDLLHDESALVRIAAARYFLNGLLLIYRDFQREGPSRLPPELTEEVACALASTINIRSLERGDRIKAISSLRDITVCDGEEFVRSTSHQAADRWPHRSKYLVIAALAEALSNDEPDIAERADRTLQAFVAVYSRYIRECIELGIFNPLFEKGRQDEFLRTYIDGGISPDIAAAAKEADSAADRRVFRISGDEDILDFFRRFGWEGIDYAIEHYDEFEYYNRFYGIIIKAMQRYIEETPDRDDAIFERAYRFIEAIPEKAPIVGREESAAYLFLKRHADAFNAGPVGPAASAGALSAVDVSA